MSLFKNKKNDNKSALISLIDEKFSEARGKHEKRFYYPLDEKDVDMVRAYCLSRYGALVEVDHKTNNTIIYKFYGYSLTNN